MYIKLWESEIGYKTSDFLILPQRLLILPQRHGESTEGIPCKFVFLWMTFNIATEARRSTEGIPCKSVFLWLKIKIFYEI